VAVEGAGGGLADASAGPGDDCGPVGEIEHGRNLTVPTGSGSLDSPFWQLVLRPPDEGGRRPCFGLVGGAVRNLWAVVSDAEDPDAVPIKPAATVIPLRDGPAGVEVLVLRRDTNLAFHGGSWVFPGGRVDDHELAAAPDDLEAARLAAVREAHEEAGLHIAPTELVTLSHWTTPLGRNRRFATWFFVVAAPSADVVIDDGEIREFEWHTIDAAIAGCDSGEIMLAGPTYVSLLRLQVAPTVPDALAFAAGRTDDVFLPRLVKAGRQTVSVYQGDPAYDGGPLDGDGPRHRMRMLEPGYEYINDLDPIPPRTDRTATR
jgi:8-oxo-dGTP pyrophosphatase MutT (NUDIX family)